MGTIFLLIYQQQKVVKETSNMLPPKLNLRYATYLLEWRIQLIWSNPTKRKHTANEKAIIRGEINIIYDAEIMAGCLLQELFEIQTKQILIPGTSTLNCYKMLKQGSQEND